MVQHNNNVITEKWGREQVGWKDTPDRSVSDIIRVLCSPEVGVRNLDDLRALVAIEGLVSLLPPPISLADRAQLIRYVNRITSAQEGPTAVEAPPPPATTSLSADTAFDAPHRPQPPSAPFFAAPPPHLRFFPTAPPRLVRIGPLHVAPRSLPVQPGAKPARRPCRTPGCSRRDAGGGRCQRHGGGRRCRSTGCPKGDAGGGFCVRHGGGRRCLAPGCRLSVRGNGLCLGHGGGRCRSAGCPKGNAGGGFCHAHGGGKTCTRPECRHVALAGGLCRSHGGGHDCAWSGCALKAVRRGLCGAHGGGKPPCRYGRLPGQEQCASRDAGGGFCIKHGGGKRCSAGGCQKLDRGGGFCIKHGGGQRCFVSGCDKSRARKGYCVRHFKEMEKQSALSLVEEGGQPLVE